MKIRRFEDLECWQEARKLVKMVYECILYASLDQNYLDENTFAEIYNQADKVSQINSGLIKYLFSKRNNAKTL